MKIKKLKNVLQLLLGVVFFALLAVACETPEMDLELEQEINYYIEKDSIKEGDI